MKKRLLSLVLTVLIILPVVLTAGSVFAVQIQNTFENNTAFSENADRYIVKFKPNIAENEISSVLDKVAHKSISESASLLYSVVANKGFFNRYGSLFEYYEPDSVRTALATTNDPVEIPAYENLSVYSAWDMTFGDSDVTVAVLDTGIDRTHEELRGTNILSGYDAVTKTEGIDIDTVGHGTGVIGLIAATANNTVGFAGIANGVSILPVRISESGTDIYSSDLIDGIRYAADNGAKVINMSIGGYAYSQAEQEAVDYAISKGCILIAAAGNDGELPYADQKCYPASYNGVISVASCDENGKRSSFSQYNDAVDVTAYGEDLPIAYVKDGVSEYKTDSGTSYSCALVSGIAALTASYIDKDARFDNEEFLALIVETCGQKRTNSLGHGIIDAQKILKASRLPIITGITNGGVYTDGVTIRFNRGTALLDDEPIEDGETIIANGKHTLVVTDGENSKTIKFNLNYDPLYYDYREFPTYSYFEFERGTATLDGFPYKSKDKITASGKHTFVIFDGDERREKEIYVQYSLPTVYGVQDGGKYTDPVNIHIIGDGRAELDGRSVYGELAVMTEGKHVLEVFSGNEAVSKKYSFEIKFPYATVYESDYGNATAAIDEEKGYFFVYNDSLVGTAVYDITKPEQYLHFLNIGRVYSHVFTETELLLFGDNGITVIDRETALEGETAIKETFVHEGAELYIFAENTLYVSANGSLLRINPETLEAEPILELGFIPEKAIYDRGNLCFVAPSSDNIVRILDLTTNLITEFDTGFALYGKKVCFAEGYFAVGNRVYDTLNGSLVLETSSNSAVMIKSGLFYTDNRITEIETAKEKGVFPSPVSEIVIGRETMYVFGVEPYYTFIKSGPTGVTRFGAARKNEKAFGATQTVNEFRKNLFYDKYSPVISTATSGGNVYMLFKGMSSLYGFASTDFSLMSPIPLRFTPSKIIVSGGYLAVAFESADKIFIAPENNIDNGIYFDISGRCSSMFVHNKMIYAITNGVLTVYPLDNSEPTVTDIKADKIATDGKFIYALENETLSVLSFDLTNIRSLDINSKDFAISSVISAEKNIYSLETLELLHSFDSNVLTVKDNTVITENGVYSLETKEYIGDLGVTEPEQAIITQDNSVIAFSKAIISVSSWGNGLEAVNTPEISGVSDSAVFLGKTKIDFKNGIGFLNGKAFKSGTTVSEIGEHSFMLVLPCGRNIIYNFSIQTALSGIEFVSPSRTVSIGESVTLRIKYLPNNAPKVPITFKCESDGIEIGKNGRIKAIKDGKHVIIAEAKTDYGVFRAECVITVVNTLITPKPDSSLHVDRDNGFLLGILPDTTVDALKNSLNHSEDIQIFNKNGEEAIGNIGTGTVVRLTKNGIVSDELKCVLTGDIDGDAFITAYDLYLLEQILRGKEYPPEAILASDINGNGTHGDNDYRALKNIILKKTDANVGTPSLNLFGKAYAQTVSKVHNGDYIDVILCLESCKNVRALSGVLGYGTGLEFVKAQTIGWKAEVRDFENNLYFYAYDSNGAEIKEAFTAVISLRFRVNAPNGESTKIISENMTAVFTDRCEKIIFKPTDIILSEESFGDFNIEFFNAYSFKFNPEVNQYKATIPHNSALADIHVTSPKDDLVTITSLTVPDGTKTTVYITYTDESDETSTYSIEVKRDKAPRFDSNCRLSKLEVEGFHLTPSFNPDILHYTISVPFGTQKVNIYAVAQNGTAKVIIGDTALTGEKTRIPITIGAPDGEVLSYSLTVKVLPDESKPQDDLNDSEGNNVGTTIAVIAVFMSIFAFILIFIQTKKEPFEMQKNSNNEQA
ncbi:MAG: S8 family serine peptidase [Clostridia bacterium]|nr:S8 family serine peptidase [Clostridia bacterium]